MIDNDVNLVLWLTVASKKYFESQVRASKDVSMSEVKKKRMVARRTKVLLSLIIGSH